MHTPSGSATGATATPASEHIIYQTENKPLRFQGWLLGASDVVSRDREGYATTTRARLFRTVGGKYIWSTQRITGFVDLEKEPERDNIEHGEAVAYPTAQEAWEERPSQNARVVQATTKVWHEAADNDKAVRDLLYEDLD